MMRRTDVEPTRGMSLALVVALLVALVFAAGVSAAPAEPAAPDFPNAPHCFYGTVITDRGIPLPGMTVLAKAVSGYWTGQLTTVVDELGRFGWDGHFCIPGYDSVFGTGAKEGDQIGFYVNGIQALLKDVATGKTSTTYPFQYFGNTELQLIVALQQTITATAGPGGKIAPAGAVKVSYGADQTFVFTPDTGYQIDQVLVDGVADPAAAAAGQYTFPNVRANHTISVTFIRSNYNITLTAGTGCTITPSGNQVVPLHGDITFTIGAQPGYVLSNVTVDGVAKGPVTTVPFINVTADHSLSATCTQLFTITPIAGPGGKIVPGTPQTVIAGASVTFQITPDAGFVIQDVKVNGVSVGPVTTYTFPPITANGTIEATFKATTAQVKVFLPFIFK